MLMILIDNICFQDMFNVNKKLFVIISMKMHLNEIETKHKCSSDYIIFM